jgi:hydroxymethylglutaryl-CoA reductase
MIENAVGSQLAAGNCSKLHREWQVGLGANGCGRTFRGGCRFVYGKAGAVHWRLRAWMSSQEMIGQVQLLDLAGVDAAQDLIETNKHDLLEKTLALNPGLARHGGGIRGLEVRRIDGSPIGSFLVVHLILDVADAMGANMVNTEVESLAPLLEELTGGRAHLRILSNLSDRRLASAEVRLPPNVLAFEDFSGEDVRDGVIEAWAFAEADPYGLPPTTRAS